MGCGSCGNNNGSHSPGCGNNGSCSTGSCNKLNVYNWLTDMVLPEDYKPFNIVEVRFKGSKKQFYKNVNNLELFTGDKVIVDSDIGYDVGEISLAGELVKLHLKKYGVEEDNSEMRNIRSIATEEQLLFNRTVNIFDARVDIYIELQDIVKGLYLDKTIRTKIPIRIMNALADIGIQRAIDEYWDNNSKELNMDQLLQVQ